MTIQGNQTQISHKAATSQSGGYIGRETSLPSPDRIQQGGDQYESRYGITANANREQSVASYIMGVKSQYYDEIKSAFNEQRESIPTRQQGGLPGEPQVADFVQPKLKSEPTLDPELIEFYIRRDAGAMGKSGGSLGLPTEIQSWATDSERVYQANRAEIKREYEQNYPKYQKAHAAWYETYLEGLRIQQVSEQMRMERAQIDAKNAAQATQKAQEKEYVDDFNKHWSSYYGEEAKSVDDVNRLTYGAKQSFQAAEQRMYEQKYNDLSFSDRKQSSADKSAAAIYEFGVVARDATRATDLDHLIGLQQPLAAAHSALPVSTQRETRQFVKDFNTNVEIAKIDRKNQLQSEKYQNEFRQELKSVGFTDSEIAHVERVARERQKPTTFGDQFTRSSYERRLDDFIRKNPESHDYLTGGGSVGATAQFMGERDNIRSREVIKVGDNTYYVTRYDSGYEIRDNYGQIRSAGYGNVPDDIFNRGIKPLYFGNSLTPRYNPMKNVNLPAEQYEPIDVSDVILEIQTKKLTGYELPETDTPSGIETTPAWGDVELVQGFRKQIDDVENKFFQQPMVKSIIDTVKRIDADPRVQVFTNPMRGGLGNPIETALQLTTGKSTRDYVDSFLKPYIPKSSNDIQQPDMRERGNQYKFIRGIPIGLTVGTAEMLATIRAAGEYGVGQVTSKGLKTVPPMATASVTAVVTGMVEGYKTDPAAFAGEFIGISKGMGIVGKGAKSAVTRVGQASGIVRGRTLIYTPKTGQQVPYASKSWMVSQILENEAISGARGVSKPVQYEYSPQFGYKRSILTRDPVDIGDTGVGAQGFFMTISDKYVEPVGGYFLEKGNIFDKVQGGSRIYLLDDIRTVRLPEQVKQRVYERIEQGRDFSDIYSEEIIPRALEQHRATGEPIAVPSPKRAKMSTKQPELEAFVVSDNLSPGTFITDQAFVGLSNTGTPISRIRVGAQSKIKSGGLSTWGENLRYNWDVGYGLGRFYNKNYLKSMAEQGYWKDVEIFDRSVPGYSGEYERHGYEHSVGVSRNMQQMIDKSSTLRYLTNYEGAWLRGRYHDITKIVDSDPRVPYPHAWAAGEAIRTGALSTPALRRLSQSERNVIARDIAQHTDITPELSLQGIKTRIVDRPSLTSRALANADRLDLVRFGNTVVDYKKIFTIPEDYSRFNFKRLDKSSVRSVPLDQSTRVEQYKNIDRIATSLEIRKQQYLGRLQKQRVSDRSKKLNEDNEYYYKQRQYPVKPYPTRVYTPSPYSTKPYQSTSYSVKLSTKPYNYGYKSKSIYTIGMYPAKPYTSTPYPAKPYPSTPYPAKPYPSTPYPAKPYPTTPYPAKPYPSTTAITPPQPIRVKTPDVKIKTQKKTTKSKVTMKNVTNVNIRLPKTAIFGLDTKNVGNVLNPDAVTKTYVDGVLKTVKRIKKVRK
jgi:hypothetical protein